MSYTGKLEISTALDTSLDTPVPVSPTADSLNDIMSKATGGRAFDKSTDSLEAISDKIGSPETSLNTTLNTINGTVTNIGIAVTTILSGTPQIVSKTTPVGSVTAWTIASHKLFTVTGAALVRVFGVVGDTLVGAGTLEVGVAGATAGCIAQVANATTLATGDILANSGTATLIPLGQTNEYALISNTDIDITVGAAEITSGSITFYCQWLPVSVAGAVVAANWD